MKNVLKYVTMAVLSVAILAGCSKQPTEEVNAAKSVVDSVITEGAEKYAPEEAKKINDDLAAAMTEIKAQDGKFFKNYSKAQEMLIKVQADANNLKAGLAAKKEEAQNNAAAAFEAAKVSIDEAKVLLAKAPKGKGSQADIEAMKSDVKGLEESLAEVQASMDSEDYRAASEKSDGIKAKASEVSEQIKQAMEKVGAKKK